MQFLYQAAWPADRCSYRTLGIAEAEEQFFTVLRQKSRAGLQ